MCPYLHSVEKDSGSLYIPLQVRQMYLTLTQSSKRVRNYGLKHKSSSSISNDAKHCKPKQKRMPASYNARSSSKSGFEIISNHFLAMPHFTFSSTCIQRDEQNDERMFRTHANNSSCNGDSFALR
mmetsp:Transcript_2745/g.3987  ORF Transcript_2745/g.3987 Transcript_2745/m.3987 type:complete len:125 (+) Transcript_2745:758-1132(+)